MTPRRNISRLSHALAGRLGVPDVVDIVSAAPPVNIEQHLAGLPLVHPSGGVRRLTLPIADVVAGRGGHPWWVMALRVGSDPRVGGMAWPCAEPWVLRTAAEEGPPGKRLTTLFASSPGSVVPVHFDYHHNLLFQIAGVKDVVVAPTDAIEADIERALAAGHRNLSALPPEPETIRLTPGAAVYIPPFTPHWVVGREDVSISVSCAWTTKRSQDEHLVRFWNARQRRLGLHPRVPDGARATDRFKATAVRARSRLRRPA